MKALESVYWHRLSSNFKLFFILWTKQRQQRIHSPKTSMRTLWFVQWNNCSGDLVLTILSRQSFSCAFHLASLFPTILILSVTLPGSWSLCTNTNGTERLVVHWRTFVWQSRIMVGRLDPDCEREGRQREQEGPRQAALALFTTKSHCLMWSRSRLQSSSSHRMCSG